jgi:hypothetical protein
MKWRRVVVEDRRPSTGQWYGVRNRLRNILRGREMKRGLLNGDRLEPDDVPVIVGELSMVVIVATWMVRLKMAMNG